MSMIFPGMDPYLEAPSIWSEVHTSLIVYVRDRLQPLVRPRYVARMGTRVYLEGPDRDIIPDVWLRERRPQPQTNLVALAEADVPEVMEAHDLEITEPYVEIIDRNSGQRVVTVIEAVSPTNKYAGPGRESYQEKQREVLRSDAHLIEIDLLRAGPHVLAVPVGLVRRHGNYHYLVGINRAAESRLRFEVHRRTVRERLPRIRVPLAEGDPDVVLDLQAVLAHAYEAGSYRDTLHYEEPCDPPLSPEDQLWANQLIQAARQGS